MKMVLRLLLMHFTVICLKRYHCQGHCHWKMTVQTLSSGSLFKSGNYVVFLVHRLFATYSTTYRYASFWLRLIVCFASISSYSFYSWLLHAMRLKIIPCISIDFQLLPHKDEGSFVRFLGNRVVN